MPRFSVLDARKNKNHPVNKLKANADQLRSVQNKNVEADSADELMPDLGNITQGNFVSLSDTSTSSSPTDSQFSGSFVVGRGITFPEGDITIGGASNGNLNAGFTDDGDLIINSVILNGTALDAGLIRNEEGYITEQNTTNGSELRTMQIGMIDNGTYAEGRIEFNEPSSSSVTVPNGDFATNDMTNWTVNAGTWDASAGYAVGTASSPTKPSIKNTTKIAVTAGNTYTFIGQFSASCSGTYGTAVTFSVVTKLDVKFYTAGDALVSTVNVGTRTGSQAYATPAELSQGGASLGWGSITKNILVPATATKYEFVAYINSFSGDSCTLSVDDFTCVQVAAQSAIVMKDGALFYEKSDGTEFEIKKSLEEVSIKTANQAITNNTAANVTDLLFTVAANTIYWFDLTVKITTTTAGGTMDAQLSFTLPSGAAIAWGSKAGTVSDMEVVNSTTTPNTVGTGALTIGFASNATSIFRFGGFITTSSTAGTVQLQARQNTSNANTFQIDKASFIRYTDLSGANLTSPAYYTDAEAQDAVGGLLTDTATINFTYTPNTSITADVIDGSLGEDKLSFNIVDVLLTGLAAGTNAVIAATDTIKEALQKLQAQITGYTNGSNTIQVKDNAFSITDEADVTKIAKFAIGSQATGTTVVVTVPAFSGVMTTNAGIQTLTNKRITKRTVGVASTSTPTPDVSSYDQYQLTALAANATIGAPTGTPTQGEWLIIRIKDNGTSRTLTWNAIYRAIGVTLPTATVANKTLYVFAIYNATDVKWDVTDVKQEA